MRRRILQFLCYCIAILSCMVLPLHAERREARSASMADASSPGGANVLAADSLPGLPAWASEAHGDVAENDGASSSVSRYVEWWNLVCETLAHASPESTVLLRSPYLGRYMYWLHILYLDAKTSQGFEDLGQSAAYLRGVQMLLALDGNTGNVAIDSLPRAKIPFGLMDDYMKTCTAAYEKSLLIQDAAYSPVRSGSNILLPEVTEAPWLKSRLPISVERVVKGGGRGIGKPALPSFFRMESDLLSVLDKVREGLALDMQVTPGALEQSELVVRQQLPAFAHLAEGGYFVEALSDLYATSSVVVTLDKRIQKMRAFTRELQEANKIILGAVENKRIAGQNPEITERLEVLHGNLLMHADMLKSYEAAPYVTALRVPEIPLALAIQKQRSAILHQIATGLEHAYGELTRRWNAFWKMYRLQKMLDG